MSVGFSDSSGWPGWHEMSPTAASTGAGPGELYGHGLSLPEPNQPYGSANTVPAAAIATIVVTDAISAMRLDLPRRPPSFRICSP